MHRTAKLLRGDQQGGIFRIYRRLDSEGAADIRLVGWKQGALLALLAGVLDPAIDAVSSREAPESFLALATAPYTFWPSVNFPRNALKHFDLKEVRAALGTRLIEDGIGSTER